MSARILDLADAAAALIAKKWAPTSPDAVSREYGPDIGLNPDDAATLIAGRQVFVFPGAYAMPQLLDRQVLDKRYTLFVVVLEQYTAPAGSDAGIPPKAWMDDRVLFTETLFTLLRDPDLVLLQTVIPDLENGSTVDAVYDFDLFQEQRTFRSQMTLNFQEAGPL